MAKSDGVEPADSILMLANAHLFEKKAVGVMKTAQKSDRQIATLILDCVWCRSLWMEMTLLDLAVKSKCDIFVEECCQEAIDARMYGDMDPYQNSLSSILLNTFPLFGLWAAIGVGAGSILKVKFKIPPVDHVVRGSTQRRKKPEGYPDRPNLNPTLISLSDDPNVLVLRCDAAYPSKVCARCGPYLCVLCPVRVYTPTFQLQHALVAHVGIGVVCVHVNSCAIAT